MLKVSFSVVARVGNAKENLVALLEQIDGFRSLVLVRRLLPALGIILLKIKAWVYNVPLNPKLKSVPKRFFSSHILLLYH